MLWSCNEGWQVTYEACCECGNIAEGRPHEIHSCADGSIAKGGMLGDRCLQGLSPNSNANVCAVGT